MPADSTMGENQVLRRPTNATLPPAPVHEALRHILGV